MRRLHPIDHAAGYALLLLLLAVVGATCWHFFGAAGLVSLALFAFAAYVRSLK